MMKGLMRVIPKYLTLVALLLLPLSSYSQKKIIGENGNNDNDVEYAKDASTEINVKDADIAAIIKIFAKKTKRNFILDERVKGKVSIYLPGKVSSEESIRILDSVLQLKGFTSVPIGDNLWKIVPAKDAKQSTIPTLLKERSETPSSVMVTRVLSLKYVGADDVKQLLSPLVSGDGLMNAYTGTNSLILIDSEDNIVRLERIISTIDVPFTDREMTIIPVKHADAVEIATKLNEILGQDQDSSTSGTGTSSTAARDLLRSRSTSSSKASSKTVTPTFASSTTVSARAREPKMIPDERTNSIIVVADEDTTARIRALISQLDSSTDLSGNRFYVYRCQYADAEELADVLAGLVGGGSSTRSTSSNRDFTSGLSSSRNTGSLSRGNRFNQTQSRLQGNQRTPGRSRTENFGSRGGTTSVQIGEDISITADPATNSLIIFAGKTDYNKIVQLLKDIDIKRRQVLVEAMLLEVGVDDNMVMGTEFLSSAGGKDGGVLAQSEFGNNLAQLFSDPTQLSAFSVAAASSGTLTLPGDITIPTQTVLINAAHTNSNVNVLSSPNILATDNQQAEIVVGQNVPFLASTATSGDNLNNTFNQIDRQDVGITLRLTPQITSRDFVKLEVFTEVSSVVAATAASELGPTTTVRTSETSVITKDGQMVVIGGLLGDDISTSESGVPFLKDIPFFGHVFKQQSESRRRTNLLIFITPRIIKDQFDHRDNTIERRDTMEIDIAANDVFPERSEILRNEHIDQVSESEIFTGRKPGTILAPAKKDLSASTTAADLAAADIANNNDVIELEISPDLPPEPAEPKFLKKSMRGSYKPKAQHYIVMELAEESKGNTSLPFISEGQSKLFGLIVPEESNAFAKGFFKVGSEYFYVSNGSKVAVTPVGIFPSEQEATAFYEGTPKSWYTLSPYEIMNIGKWPWVQGPNN